VRTVRRTMWARGRADVSCPCGRRMASSHSTTEGSSRLIQTPSRENLYHSSAHTTTKPRRPANVASEAIVAASSMHNTMPAVVILAIERWLLRGRRAA
jgi:hypothetical protein